MNAKRMLNPSHENVSLMSIEEFPGEDPVFVTAVKNQPFLPLYHNGSQKLCP